MEDNTGIAQAHIAYSEDTTHETDAEAAFAGIPVNAVIVHTNQVVFASENDARVGTMNASAPTFTYAPCVVYWMRQFTTDSCGS